MKNNKLIIAIATIVIIYAGFTLASNYLQSMNESLIVGFDKISHIAVGGFLTAYNTNRKVEVKDIETQNGTLGYRSTEIGGDNA